MGASGSSSDAQIFNCRKLKRRFENRTLGLPPPEPLGPGGQIYITSCWGTMPLPLCTGWSNHTADDNWPEEERIANYRISRDRRVVGNSFGILVRRFPVLMTIMAENCERHCANMCGTMIFVGLSVCLFNLFFYFFRGYVTSLFFWGGGGKVILKLFILIGGGGKGVTSCLA